MAGKHLQKPEKRLLLPGGLHRNRFTCGRSLGRWWVRKATLLILRLGLSLKGSRVCLVPGNFLESAQIGSLPEDDSAGRDSSWILHGCLSLGCLSLAIETEPEREESLKPEPQTPVLVGCLRRHPQSGQKALSVTQQALGTNIRLGESSEPNT